MSIMMMLMLSRSSFSEIQTVVTKQNMTGHDNTRLHGRNKKNSTVLLYVYTSAPLQHYQYVPKETVRHQASCEELYIYAYPVSLAATK